LFALVCGPAPSTATGGVRIGGLLVCAIDGTTLTRVPQLWWWPGTRIRGLTCEDAAAGGCRVCY
jgi:hypothetical protein